MAVLGSAIAAGAVSPGLPAACTTARRPRIFPGRRHSRHSRPLQPLSKELHMDIRKKTLRHVGVIVLVSAVLAGCASPTPPKPDEARIKQFSGRGYLTDDRFAISTIDAAWTSGDATYDVALTVPARTGSFPLVIYLPALGETRSAGEAWRSAWAQGGYAVLSLQPLVADESAWSSARARAGDFTPLARERYSAKTMAARLAALQDAWRELVRRQSGRETPVDRIDLSRVAIAGYDLGAYTAMVIAGERLRDVTPPTLPMPVRAVVALSPYADFSGAALSTRYEGIRGPVLSVTSDDDWDSLGLVTAPSLRRAPFEYMPQGGKYLLTMSHLPHSAMGGGAMAEARDETSAEKYESGRQERASGGGHDGHHLGGHGGHGQADGETGHRGEERSSHAGGAAISPTDRAIGIAAIQGVSTAFLDAYVKRDPIAQEWLDQDARRWLGERGEIRSK